MSVPTDAELDQLRAVAEQTQVETCSIVRVTTTQNDYGYPVETETSTEVECRIAPITATTRERIIAERFQLVAPYTIAVPADTDVQPSDHIEANGRRFNVASGTGDRTWEIEKLVVVDEVT